MLLTPLYCNSLQVSDYLTLHIHRIKHSKQRVYYPSSKDCVLNGSYTNNQHVLVRYDVAGTEDKHLSIVLSQYKKSNDLGYTYSVYCTEKFKLSQPEKELKLCRELKGAWTLRNASDKAYSLCVGTAGGPPGHGSFGSNPQWSVFISQRTMIQIKCFAVKKLAVNVVLVQHHGRSESGASTSEQQQQNGKRIHHLYEQPIIDSGDYRHGFTVTEPIYVSAGDYTLVASTFEVGQVGNYIVKVLSSRDVDIKPIV